MSAWARSENAMQAKIAIRAMQCRNRARRGSRRIALAHPELQHAPIVGAGDAEDEAIQRGLLAGFGQVADFGGDHAADGVVLLVRERAAELLVEVLDRRQRIYQP